MTLKQLGLGLALVTTLVGAALHAQQPSVRNQRPQATIVSGSDIGFRIEGRKGNAAVGTWMVKVDGEWVEAQSALVAKPLTTR